MVTTQRSRSLSCNSRMETTSGRAKVRVRVKRCRLMTLPRHPSAKDGVMNEIVSHNGQRQWSSEAFSEGARCPTPKGITLGYVPEVTTHWARGRLVLCVRACVVGLLLRVVCVVLSSSSIFIGT